MSTSASAYRLPERLRRILQLDAVREPWTVGFARAHSALASISPPAKFIYAVKAMPREVIRMFFHLPIGAMLSVVWTMAGCYGDEALAPVVGANPDSDDDPKESLHRRRLAFLRDRIVVTRAYSYDNTLALLMGIRTRNEGVGAGRGIF